VPAIDERKLAPQRYVALDDPTAREQRVDPDAEGGRVWTRVIEKKPCAVAEAWLSSQRAAWENR